MTCKWPELYLRVVSKPHLRLDDSPASPEAPGMPEAQAMADVAARIGV